MRLVLVCVALTAALVSPALAHTGLQQTNSLASGFAHPFNGPDHILAIIAVGLWSVLAGGCALWVWPIAFLATMLAGFAAATLGLQVPFLEPVIWSSIVVLGFFVTFAVKAPLWSGAAITGLFAFFHGHAHGTEVLAANLVPFAAGFALATVGLHAVGIGLGVLAERSIGKVALRTMGGLVTFGGVALIAGWT